MWTRILEAVRMRPLTDTTAWPLFSVFDIEAENWVEVTCLCHVDELGNRRHFKGLSPYLDWLFSEHFKSDMVWAHWGGRYDHRFVIWEATLRNWQWQAMVSGNLIIILIVRHPSGREIKFCESGRLMPDSVAKIGKTVELEKLDIDRRKIGSYSMDTIIEYCFRDCDIVLKGLQLMRKTLLSVGCDFGFTLASIATRFVRRSDALEWWKFYELQPCELTGRKKMVYSPRMLEADEFSKPAYFGGRVEVYRKGFHRDLYYYDITSSYPWSMTHELPAYFKGFDVPATKLVSYAGRPAERVQNIKKSLERCGISDVSVFMPADLKRFNIPVLPLRDDKKHRIVYPILNDDGQPIRGRWTNIELAELWNQGKDHGVTMFIHGQATFEPLPYLNDFVQKFFNMRLEAIARKDEFSKYAFKILLNSLYGKLVETTTRRSVLYGDDVVQEAIKRHGEEAVRASPAPGAYFLTTESDGPFRHVAAGCYVTARSRLRLLEGIQHAIACGAKVFYCDTDSLIVDKPIYGLESAKKLGDFNLETEIAEIEILASKVYKMRDKDIGPRITGLHGKVTYKSKGMPIKEDSATDGDFSANAAELRWQMFTAKMRNESAEKPTREGISGFLSDIQRGKIHPSKYELPRQMNLGDLKRMHCEDGDSEPLIWQSTG